MTFDGLINTNVKTVYIDRGTSTRVDSEHLRKVMEARKEQQLSYSLVFDINENDCLKATILADPKTKKPTFVIAY